MASILEKLQKIKTFALEMKEELLVSMIIVAVGIASFGLGFISAKTTGNHDVRIVSAGAVALPESDKINNNPSDTSGTSETVVASKSGKKYHYPWCAGAKQIAEKNKITFNSIKEAKAAGYTPAANCKGLK